MLCTVQNSFRFDFTILAFFFVVELTNECVCNTCMRNALRIRDKGIIITIMKCCYVRTFAYSNVKMKCKSFVNISTASLADEKSEVMSLFQLTGENHVSLLNTWLCVHAKLPRRHHHRRRRRFHLNCVLQHQITEFPSFTSARINVKICHTISNPIINILSFQLLHFQFQLHQQIFTY